MFRPGEIHNMGSEIKLKRLANQLVEWDPFYDHIAPHEARRRIGYS